MDRSGNVSLPMVFLIVVFVGLIGLLVSQLLSDDGQGNQLNPEPTAGAETTSVDDQTQGTPTGEAIETSGPRLVDVSTGPRGASIPLRPENGKPTEIAGIVYDSEGRPLPGARVILFRYDTDMSNESLRLVQRFREVALGSAVTDISGAYVFPNLPAGQVLYLRASAANHISQIKDTVRVGKLVDFALEPGSPVIGTVLDADTGEPVRNAFVKAYFKTQNQPSLHRSFRWEEKLYTDNDGKFRIPGAPHVKVKWLLYHDDYEDHVEDLPVEAGLTNEITLRMQRGLVVRGIVRNKLTDEPIANVRVQTATSLIPERTVRTDENGVFTVTGVPRGQISFSFSVPDFTSMRMPYTLGEGDDWSEEDQNALQFRLDPAGRAAGVVVDVAGNPIDNARIYVARILPIFAQVRPPQGATRPDQPEMVTGADGQFLVSNIGTDMEHRIVVVKDGIGIGVSEDIMVGPGELRDGFIIKLTSGGEIQGRVVDENGAPIAGAEITATIPPFRDANFAPGSGLGQGETRTLTSDLSGVFKVDRLWAGTVNFDIRHPDHIPLDEQKVQLDSNEEQVSREFRMRIGRSISGICVLQGEGSLEDVQVTISRPFSSQPVAVVNCDENGAYRFDALTRGTYTVVAKLPGYSSEKREEVQADSTDINLTLVANGGLIGDVATTSGQSVREFNVTVAPYYGEEADQVMRAQQESLGTRSFSDEGGRFFFEDVPPGNYIVTVRGRGARVAYTEENVRVTSGQPTIMTNIRLGEGGVLTGFATNAQGEGLQGAMIRAERVDATGKIGARAMPSVKGETGGGEMADSGGASAFGDFVFTTSPSGKDGKWVIQGVPEGQYRLSITSETHVAPRQPETVTVTEGQETRRDWILSFGARIVLTVVDDLGQPVIAATGQVFNAATNQRVIIPGRGARSNNQGVMELSGLEPGTYRITLNRSGYLVTETRVTVTEGQVVQQTETLEKILR